MKVLHTKENITNSLRTSAYTYNVWFVVRRRSICGRKEVNHNDQKSNRVFEIVGIAKS